MKHLKLFNSESAYSYWKSQEEVLPNVSFIDSSGNVIYNSKEYIILRLDENCQDVANELISIWRKYKSKSYFTGNCSGYLNLYEKDNYTISVSSPDDDRQFTITESEFDYLNSIKIEHFGELDKIAFINFDDEYNYIQIQSHNRLFQINLSDNILIYGPTLG